jgi:hypothetical protein
MKAILSISLFAIASASFAGIVNTPLTGTDLTTVGSFVEARGRVATNSWKQGLFGSTFDATKSTGNAYANTFTSGVKKSFTLSYTAATKTFSYQLGSGPTQSYVYAPGVGKDFVGFRVDVKSSAQGGKNSNSMKIDDMVYTDFSGATNIAAAESNGGNVVGPAYYFSKLGKDFTLTGTALYTKPVNAASANDDRVTFSIRGLDAEVAPQPVPEPATMAVLGLGLAAFYRRKKSA